jgi:transposase
MAVPVKEDHRHVDTSVDIDLGETAFHLVTLGEAGKVLVRKKFTHIAGLHRKHAELTDRLGGVLRCPSCWPRTASQGHDVRLIPTQLAKPFVKFNKNDFMTRRRSPKPSNPRTCALFWTRTNDQLDLQAIRRVRIAS